MIKFCTYVDAESSHSNSRKVSFSAHKLVDLSAKKSADGMYIMVILGFLLFLIILKIEMNTNQSGFFPDEEVVAFSKMASSPSTPR